MSGNISFSGKNGDQYYSRSWISNDRAPKKNYQNNNYGVRWNPSPSFMVGYLSSFSKDNFSESICLETFEKFKEDFEKINSSSSLRKIYDTYLDILSRDKDIDLQIQIWFAKIGYQEKRKILPEGFLSFLNQIYNKLSKDHEKFRDFLEVFVAYHKYFNPKA